MYSAFPFCKASLAEHSGSRDKGKTKLLIDTSTSLKQRMLWKIWQKFNLLKKVGTDVFGQFCNGTARFKIVNNCLNTNIYSYLETSGGQSYNLYLNVVHFLTPVLIRYLWQLKTVVFLHWCLICAVPLAEPLTRRLLFSSKVETRIVYNCQKIILYID